MVEYSSVFTLPLGLHAVDMSVVLSMIDTVMAAYVTLVIVYAMSFECVNGYCT